MTRPLRPWLASLLLLLPLLLLVAAPLGCAGEREPVAATAREERMVALCSTHHAIPPAALARLDDEDVRVLRALARDRERPLWLRSRAASLAGVRPDDDTRALWRELRAAAERELRVQAAWAEGLSLPPEARLPFATELLQDDDERVREAGAHLLVIASGTDPTGRAREVARTRLLDERSEAVRAVLRRKMSLD